MTRPLFDVPPIDNGACLLPKPAFDPAINPRVRAAYGRDSDRVFFPPREPGHKTASRWVRMAEDEAKKVCVACPAIETCRQWTLDREAETGNLEHGIWGGLTEHQRANILRKRQAGAA